MESESGRGEIQPTNWIRTYIEDATKLIKQLSSECKIYCFVLLNVSLFALFHVFKESVDHDDDVTLSKKRVLGEGWFVMSRKKDIADFEWTFWFSQARFIVISMFISHTVISVLCKKYLPEIRETLLFIHGLLWVYGLFGGAYVITMSLLCVTYFYVSQFRDETYLWVLTVSLMFTTHLTPFNKFMLFGNHYSVMAHSSFMFAIFRCCSFGFERCRISATPNEDHFTAFHLFRYNFYLPYYFFGPVMTYDSFSQQSNETGKSPSYKTLLKDIGRIAGYMIVIDFLLHFFHISSLPLDAEFMQRSPSFVLGFLAFTNVYLDWMKGRLLYAVTGSVAKHVDGYDGAPGCCKNIATICTFADTYFDRGIQHWLCRYIYDPLGEGHQKVTKEGLAGGISFIIVVLMQGLSIQTCLWAFLNWFGLTFELYLLQRFQDTQYKRIKHLLLGLNYWCILLFNCIGINGVDSFGWYVKGLFMRGGYVGLFLTYLLGYSYVSINTELQEQMKQKKV